MFIAVDGSAASSRTTADRYPEEGHPVTDDKTPVGGGLLGKGEPGRPDLIDITSFARDGSTRSVYVCRAMSYNTPRGSVMGYMPQLNMLCARADFSKQSGQPLTKHIIVEVTAAETRRAASPPAASTGR